MHQTFDAALGVNLLQANQTEADHNREHFDAWGITCLNLMSSPGAGKTVLLEKTLTEGEDKPLKYPVMFQEADCLLVTKMDLAPHLDIDLQRIENNVRQINPNVTIIPVSAKTGEGLNIWLNWVNQQVKSEVIVS